MNKKVEPYAPNRKQRRAQEARGVRPKVNPPVRMQDGTICKNHVFVQCPGLPEGIRECEVCGMPEGMLG